MNIKLIHVVMVIVGTVAAALPQLEVILPVEVKPYVMGLAGLLTVVTTVLGALSPSVTTPVVTTK